MASVTDPSLLADVAVCGGGISGLTTALGLAQAGLSVVCVDRMDPAAQTAAGHDVRTTAIALGSRRVLESVGVWESMAPDASPIEEIRIADGSSSQTLHFDHTEVGEEPFGHILENRILRQRLHEAAARQPGLTHLAPAETVALRVDEGLATVSLSEGRSLRARLVIGADGRDSAIREAAGIRLWKRTYDRQAAIVCVIAHEKPHQGVALEHFRAAGPFAVLPMTDDPHTGEPRSSIVWSEDATLAPSLMEADEAPFTAILQDRVGTWLGRIRLASSRAQWQMRVQHARTYIAPRLALVADAAHAMHPIAGQGLNLGIRDVAQLISTLTDAAVRGQDIGSLEVLRRYQRARRLDNWSMLAATDGLNALFSTANRPVAGVRRLGLAGVAAIGPVKKFFMTAAMGMSPKPGGALLSALR